MSNTDIVDIAVRIAMRCGFLAEPYIKWHEQATRTWIDLQPFWQEQLKLRKNTMVTACQMGFITNVANTGQVDEEFDIQMDQFGQVYLAR